MRPESRKIGAIAVIAAVVLALEVVAMAGAVTTARAWLGSDEGRAVGKATRIAARSLAAGALGGRHGLRLHCCVSAARPGAVRAFVVDGAACDVARLRAEAIALRSEAERTRARLRIEARALAREHVRATIERLRHDAI